TREFCGRTLRPQSDAPVRRGGDTRSAAFTGASTHYNSRSCAGSGAEYRVPRSWRAFALSYLLLLCKRLLLFHFAAGPIHHRRMKSIKKTSVLTAFQML